VNPLKELAFYLILEPHYMFKAPVNVLETFTLVAFHRVYAIYSNAALKISFMLGCCFGRHKIMSFNFAPFRSMPTSAALDVVAKHLNLKFFEVFFGTANFLLLSSCSVVLGAFIFLLNARFPLAGNSLVI
jgi:hypothetical protein